jgi:gas vesicle protein
MFPQSSPSDRDGTVEIPAVAGLAVLLIGAALGAIAGLLLAPKSGRDLRADLLERAADWKDHAADALAQGRESLVNAVESTRNPLD